MTFIPTDKQLAAIEKMETFCLIKSHRTIFWNKDEFDSYFKLLLKRWAKRAKLLDDVSSWKTSYSAINNAVKAKKDKYYSNEGVLKAYWITYINKYNPTIKQLEGQLSKKNKDFVVVTKVVDSIKHLIQEGKMIDNLVSTLKYRWKNINYITTKLYNKKFDWGLIKETLDKIRSWWSLLIEYTLEDKVSYYKKKGKSKFEISRMFIERQEDKELVENAIEKVFWEDGENDILEEKILVLKRKNVEPKKIISRLLSKWFKYWDIIEYL